ncbi:histidine kinase dimerization/phospho-acceptor domain-containing protein [Rhodococcus qingshengii]|uniref:HAMP domain-containing sensor histidine kinase n=1 Tax=Rhodococcus qingshengii TaxID=334542 RepID=UPI0036DDF75A
MDSSEEIALRSVTSAAETIARGDYSARASAASHDDLERLAAAVNAMAEDLEKDDEYRRQLISNLSHELQTPITALRAILENLADGITSQSPAALNHALHQTERLGHVVTDLLALSQSADEAIEPNREDFVVQEWLTALAAQYGRISFTVDPPTLQIHADRDRLTQVTTKLIEDAVKNSPSDENIEVHAHPVDGAFHLDIIDQRSESSTPDHYDAFRNFFKGGSTDGGTGLGLSVAKSATHLQGGTIERLNHSFGRHVRVSLPQSRQVPQGGES